MFSSGATTPDWRHIYHDMRLARWTVGGTLRDCHDFNQTKSKGSIRVFTGSRHGREACTSKTKREQDRDRSRRAISVGYTSITVFEYIITSLSSSLSYEMRSKNNFKQRVKAQTVAAVHSVAEMLSPRRSGISVQLGGTAVMNIQRKRHTNIDLGKCCGWPVMTVGKRSHQYV